MPLNVRRFYTSVFLVLVSAGFGWSQTVPSATPQTPAASIPLNGPTSGDVMRDRISKAKAYIAVRNYNAAIYDLENIRRESADQSVQGVVNVLLMNSYLEQGDYKRAQDLLNDFYNQQKTTKPGALATYMAVAGQVVKGARDRAERYRSLGLNITDRMLPLEALNDLEKMRETLELVITQSKEIGNIKAKSDDGMALLEEATNSRSLLARDTYDSRRWQDEVADTREKMANSRSVVLSAINDPNAPAIQPIAAASTPVTNKPAAQVPVQTPVMQPVADTKTVTRDRQVAGVPVEANVARNEPIYIPSAPPTKQPQAQQPQSQQPSAVKEQPKPQPAVSTTAANKAADTTPQDAAKTETPEIKGPIEVGSLLSYATRQQQPIYPSTARSIRETGVVRVDVMIDESGEVSAVQNASGPSLLVAAAKDAIRKWKFKPFLRDGQPVKAVGFVNFNFSL